MLKGKGEREKKKNAQVKGLSDWLHSGLQIVLRAKNPRYRLLLYIVGYHRYIDSLLKVEYVLESYWVDLTKVLK